MQLQNPNIIVQWGEEQSILAIMGGNDSAENYTIIIVFGKYSEIQWNFFLVRSKVLDIK